MKHDADIPRPPGHQPTVADFTEAKAAHAVGADIAHVVVGRWLLTWGKPGRKDFGDWLQDQDG